MKRTARWVIVGLWMMMAASLCLAQEGDDGGNAMGRAFGRGNGVRGTVTAAAPGSFTIRTDEGDTYQVLYSANSHLMKDRQPITAVDVHQEDGADGLGFGVDYTAGHQHVSHVNIGGRDRLPVLHQVRIGAVQHLVCVPFVSADGEASWLTSTPIKFARPRPSLAKPG